VSGLDIALRHDFGGFALDIAFTAPGAGVTALFGPSGAGKSSVILAVAGLLRTAGRIVAGEAVLQDDRKGVFVAPERRRVGVVFQDARLFPHLNVAANLRYGLRRAGPGPIGFADIVALLGLEGLLARRCFTLSGGERQRVAIGRALLAQPRLLLMDEPLASLDSPRKAEILPYLQSLKNELKIPILYVTHAMDEVVRLADHLVLIEAGRTLAAGGLSAMTARADLPLAAREDAGAVLGATIDSHAPERGLSALRLGPDLLWVPQMQGAPGRAVRLRMPAREIILARGSPGETSVHNVLRGTVRTVEPVAPHAALVEVQLAGGVVLARVTRDAVDRLNIATGQDIQAMVKSVSVDVLS
jgi:molybdate transport system ATP-binding protein